MSDIIQNPSLYLPIMDKNVTLVKVKFCQAEWEPSDYEYQRAKTYTYKTDLELEIGDYVAVEARASYAVAIVMETLVPLELETSSNHQYRWVVSHLDLKAHMRERIEYEKKLVMRVNKMRVDHVRQQMLDRLGLPSDAQSLLEEIKDDDEETAVVDLDYTDEE